MSSNSGSNTCSPPRGAIAGVAVLFAALVPIHGAGAQAPDLAAWLPADSIAVFQWGGADALADPMRATALGKVLAEPDVDRFVEQTVRGITDSIRRSAARRQTPMSLATEPLLKFGAGLWRRPAAVALWDFDFAAPEPDRVRAVAVIHLGERAGSFRVTIDQVSSLVVKARSGPAAASAATDLPAGWSEYRPSSASPRLAWGIVRDALVITLGPDTPKQYLAALDSPHHLADHAEYLAARAGLAASAEPAVASMYLDVDRLRKRMLGPKSPLGVGGVAGVLAALQSLGLDGVTSLAGVIQPADGAWRSSLYIRCASPRRGLMKTFDQAPLSDDDFLPIPADATLVYSTRCDLQRVLAADVIPDAEEAGRNAGQMNPVLATALDSAMGTEWRERLLPALGDTWVVFDAPSNGGLMLLGATLCMRTKDSQRAAEALEAAVESLIKRHGLRGVRVCSLSQGARPIAYVETSEEPIPFSPAWGTQGQWLVVAMYPQVVRATLDRLAADNVRERSILSNPLFVASRQRVAPDAHALTWYDARHYVRDIYAIALPLLHAMSGDLRRQGLRLDPAAIPPLDAIARHVGPTVVSTRSDAQGVQMVAHASLPLLTLSVPEAAVMLPPAAAMLLPAVTGAQEERTRAIALAQTKQLGMACIIYSTENDDAMPKTLDDLLPYLGGPENRSMLTASSDVPGNVSYVLTEAMPRTSRIEDPARFVMLYQKPELHGGEGTVVCFADGHVEWRPMAALQEDLERTKKMIEKAANLDGAKP